MAEVLTKRADTVFPTVWRIGRAPSLALLVLIVLNVHAQPAGDRYSFQFSATPLRYALDSLMAKYALSIVFLDDDVKGQTASCECHECRLDFALDSLVHGTGLTWIVIGNQVILKRRPDVMTQPAGTVAGAVMDSASGELISPANVILESGDSDGTAVVRQWCTVTPLGGFVLRRVPAGTYVVLVRSLGYRPVRHAVVVVPDSTSGCDVHLAREAITMQEVTVEGRRSTAVATEEISRGVYMRAAPTDQNCYMLDGGRVYNPSHFGGVLCTFSDEALNDLESALPGLPASYGGFIGGMVDHTLREGNRNRFAGSVETGILGSSLLLHGPVAPSTTLLVSGRRGYPSPSVPALNQHGVPSRLGTTELIGKLTFRVADYGQLSASGYSGSDSYCNLVASGESRLSNCFSWTNRMASLRWLGVASSSLFLKLSGSYSSYGFDLGQFVTWKRATVHAPADCSSTFALEDFGIHVEADDYLAETHTIQVGGEISRRRLAIGINAIALQSAPCALEGRSVETSLFFQDQWRVAPRLTLDIGARANTFSWGSATLSSVDPRVSSVLFLSDDFFVHASFVELSEFLHPYRNSGLFVLYPTVFWYPSSDSVPASTSLQATVGMQQSLEDGDLSWSLDAYYRAVNNVIEFSPDSVLTKTTSLLSKSLAGTGRAYGVECSFVKRIGRVTGSFTYDLCWARETVAGLNGGRPFSPPCDRRHEIRIAASYAPANDWLFGVVCLLASDQASSLTTRPSGERSYAVGVAGVAALETVDLNGGQLPGFQRLEVNARYSFLVDGLPCQVRVRFLNGYGLLDPIVWQTTGSSDVRYVWGASLDPPALLPLYPTVSLQVSI